MLSELTYKFYCACYYFARLYRIVLLVQVVPISKAQARQRSGRAGVAFSCPHAVMLTVLTGLDIWESQLFHPLVSLTVRE